VVSPKGVEFISFQRVDSVFKFVDQEIAILHLGYNNGLGYNIDYPV